jgi:vancomycin permeability regulator SanA
MFGKMMSKKLLHVAHKGWEKMFKRWMFHLIFIFLVLGVTWTLYIQWMIYSAQHKELKKADIGIVLGAALWNDVPSPALRERLNAAYELHKEGYFSKIIVSGGMDHNGSTIPEAEGMKR